MKEPLNATVTLTKASHSNKISNHIGEVVTPGGDGGVDTPGADPNRNTAPQGDGFSGGESFIKSFTNRNAQTPNHLGRPDARLGFSKP